MYELPDNVVQVFDCTIPIIEKSQSEQLQRTQEWHNKRKGRFTGSKTKDLMSCGRSTSKMEWGRPEKLIDFSETAKKYIFSKAKERQRNKVVKTSSSHVMQYGTNNEIEVVKMLKEIYPDWLFNECDFIEFIPTIAGASPDRLIIRESDKIGLEIKCAVDWGTVYSRHEVPIDQSHDDFWQLQTEMLALNVNEIMYVVAEPSEDMFDPNITDLSIKFVQASPIHQKAIIDRCMIGNKAIELYLSGLDFQSSILKACTEYEG